MRGRDEETGEYRDISRSENRRQALEVLALGEQLVGLTPAQLAKLPRALWPKAVPYGLVVALNEQGEIVQSLHDSSGTHLRMITSAKPVGDYLYLGSLDNDRIGKLKIR